jgi:hypothetical protein
MRENTSTAVLASRLNALPEALARAVEPVSQELTRCGEMVQGVRVGPSQPAAEFLDIEGVRLRIAQEQGGQPLPGQANLVERLRALPPEQPLTYVILETATRQAKCYVDATGQQLQGVLWLPAVVHGVNS